MENDGPQTNMLLPLYNEEEVFERLIGRLSKVLDDSKLRIKVIMVDDGSLDNTAALMRDVSMKDTRFTSVFYPEILGTNWL